MLVHPQNPDIHLIELRDLEQEPWPPAVRGHHAVLQRVVDWAEDYLTQPHPELGRDGPVCPYTLPALRKASFYLTVRSGRDFDRAAIHQDLLTYRDWFLELEPRQGHDAIFKTILIVYPDLTEEQIPELIDNTQESLKGDYVQEGLMIGEFHSGPPRKAGLWNPDFLPLNSPIPMLVIRNMVPTDFGFLRHDKGFVLSYLERFRDQIPTPIRPAVRQAAVELGIPMPELEDMAAIHPRVRRAIEGQELSVRVHLHRDLERQLPGPAGIAEALGYPQTRICRSVLLRTDRDQYLVFTTSVDREFFLETLAESIGEARLFATTDEEILAMLGVSPGGICPIAAGDLAVFIDDRLLDFPTLVVAAGEIEVELEIATAEILRITRARIVRFAEPQDVSDVLELAGTAHSNPGENR